MSLAVVIAARNSEATIGRTLRSLLASVDPPDEIVVVDDASDDATSAAARAEGAQVVRHERHRGCGSARNTGVAATTSEVIAFVDSDDEVAPEWAGALRARFAAGAEVCAGLLQPGPRHNLVSWTDAVVWTRQSALWSGGNFLPAVTGAGMSIRRDTFLSVGGFDEYFLASEDTELSLRLGLAGVTVTRAPEAVITWHQRSTLRGRFRQRARNQKWFQMRYWRYYGFAFANYRRLPGPTTFVSYAARLVAWLGTGRPGGKATKAEALFRPVIATADLAGAGWGWIALRLGRRHSPPPLAPASAAAERLTTPIRSHPGAVLVCPATAAPFLRFALRRDKGFLVSSGRLIRRVAQEWDRPAPWAVRVARDMGVDRTADLARRIEREGPATLGDAFSVAHAAHASRRSIGSWVVVCGPDVAAALGERWSGTPRVEVGMPDGGASTKKVVAPGAVLKLRSEKTVGAIEEAVGFGLAPSVRWLLGGTGAKRDWHAAD